jgi:hypothetical protein
MLAPLGGWIRYGTRDASGLKALSMTPTLKILFHQLANACVSEEAAWFQARAYAGEDARATKCGYILAPLGGWIRYGTRDASGLKALSMTPS